jgi:hypothetical protein
MPSNTDLALWALGTLAELFAAYIFLLSGVAREFQFLTGYLVFSVAANVTLCVVWGRHGFSSPEYFECFYVARVLETTILYAVVGELALRTARGVWFAKHMVGLFLAGLSAAVLLSSSEISLRFCFFFATSEKLYWLSGAVALGLSIWSFWQTDHESGRRLVAFRLTKVMGLYFFLHAIAYGLFHLAHVGESIWGQLASAWLPIGASLVAMSAPQSS